MPAIAVENAQEFDSFQALALLLGLDEMAIEQAVRGLWKGMSSSHDIDFTDGRQGWKISAGFFHDCKAKSLCGDPLQPSACVCLGFGSGGEIIDDPTRNEVNARSGGESVPFHVRRSVSF
jgi:hypothetical protein